MKLAKGIWNRIALSIGISFVALGGLQLWQKYDFCQGWADHYAFRAKQFRADAEKPGLTPAERREHLIASEWHVVISQKYSAAARLPWQWYPKHPLITDEEQRIAATKY